jgi:hypothetical protein
VLGSAALHDAVSEAAPEPVVVDVGGQRIDLDPADAARLRDAAAALAGTSSVARDVSVLLGQALQRRRVLALHRSEAKALVQLASEIGLNTLVREIAA